MTGLLAWLQNVPYYLIALAVIGGFGLVLWCKNQWDTIHANRESKDLEKFAINTLLKLGYSVKKENIKEAKFQLMTTYDKDNVFVAQFLNRIEYLSIFQKIIIAKQAVELLDEAISKPGSTLKQDLTIEIARLGVSVVGTFRPFGITTQTAIPCINIKQDTLLDGIDLIRNARILLEALIQREVIRLNAEPKTENTNL